VQINEIINQLASLGGEETTNVSKFDLFISSFKKKGKHKQRTLAYKKHATIKLAAPKIIVRH
jgi:hypothetical protein